jgi:hypothetical protein
MPPAACETSLADIAHVAAGPPQKSRGEAEGGAGADGAAGGVGVASANPWQVAPGVSILAILDPAGPDGTPGHTRFVPGLTLAERREILRDDEWFDVRIRRRAAMAAGDSEECQP